MGTFLSSVGLANLSGSDVLMLLLVVALGLVFGGASFYYKGLAELN